MASRRRLDLGCALIAGSAVVVLARPQPSTDYLGIGLALAAQLAGRGKSGNFIVQWVPTWLILGLYNKVVKVQGHD